MPKQCNCPSEQEHWCSGCKQCLPVGDFWGDNNRYNKLAAFCKSCDRKRRNDLNRRKREELLNER